MLPERTSNGFNSNEYLEQNKYEHFKPSGHVTSGTWKAFPVSGGGGRQRRQAPPPLCEYPVTEHILWLSPCPRGFTETEGVKVMVGLANAQRKRSLVLRLLRFHG